MGESIDRDEAEEPGRQGWSGILATILKAAVIYVWLIFNQNAEAPSPDVHPNVGRMVGYIAWAVFAGFLALAFWSMIRRALG